MSTPAFVLKRELGMVWMLGRENLASTWVDGFDETQFPGTWPESERGFVECFQKMGFLFEKRKSTASSTDMLRRGWNLRGVAQLQGV